MNLNSRSVKPALPLLPLSLLLKAITIKISPSVNAPWNPEVKPFNFSTGSIRFAELSIYLVVPENIFEKFTFRDNCYRMTLQNIYFKKILHFLIFPIVFLNIRM